MKVEIDRTAIVFDQFFKIEEATLRYEKFSGGMSRTIKRLNFERGDSVAALVVDTTGNRVLLVNQFKYPASTKDSGWITEVVAGAVDPGETPEQAIRREVLEEMGYALDRLEEIATFFVSPGGSSERIILYYAEVSDAGRTGPGGGSPAEDEDIRIEDHPVGGLDRLLSENTIKDAKTIVALQWFLRRGSRPDEG